MTNKIIEAALAARIGVLSQKLGFVVYGDVTVKDLARFYAIAYRAGMERAAEICEGQHEEDRPGDYAYAIRAEAHAQNPPKNEHDTDDM